MRWRVALLIVLFLSDRLIKNIIWFRSPEIDGDFFHTVLNTNIAFSIPIPQALESLIIPILSIIIFILIYVMVRAYLKGQTFFFWWGLVVIGAVSGLLDRMTLGGVLDYIDLGFWPVFNLSDVYIFIGVAVLIARELSSKRNKPTA